MFLSFNPVIFASPIPTTRSLSFQTCRASPNFPLAQITTTGLRSCECYDLYKQQVPFTEAWPWQESILERRKALIDNNEEDACDTLFVLQHQPVYTLGTSKSLKNLKFDVNKPPYPVEPTKRAGDVTYHGPGQLVMCPMMNLRYQNMDLHCHLRALEEVVIRALLSSFNLKASRVSGLTGVWVGDKKLAAIGIQASRWVTYQGLALNVSTDLSPFEYIYPCGIRDRGVGSIKGMLNESSSICDDGELIDIAHDSLLKAFCEVFQVELSHQPVSMLRNAKINKKTHIDDMQILMVIGDSGGDRLRRVGGVNHIEKNSD